MICLEKVKKFCKDYTKIENYNLAIADTTQTWDCHHKAGICYSVRELIERGDYYNVPPCNLIFLTEHEHNVLHNKGENNPMYGKHHSEESKRKSAKSHKGKKRGPFSDEHKRKIAEASKGHKRSNGRHWYNNGTIEKFCYECPPGFVPGRL